MGKRALCFIKRALSSAKEPYIYAVFSKEPNMPSKEPCAHSKELYVSAKEP